MVHHGALSHIGTLRVDACANRNHNAAGLVSSDDRRCVVIAKCLEPLAAGSAIKLKIAATHAGGLDFKHHLIVTRRRIREIEILNFAIACKYDPFH
jgi:hypothetical protein